MIKKTVKVVSCFRWRLLTTCLHLGLNNKMGSSWPTSSAVPVDPYTTAVLHLSVFTFTPDWHYLFSYFLLSRSFLDHEKIKKYYCYIPLTQKDISLGGFITFSNLCRGSKNKVFQTVLRIHDILGWIRIRGFMPLTNGSWFGSCYIRHWPSKCQQKTNFLTQFFLLITFWSYIDIILQR